nr:MAG TPA: hypothetical protein [Bacteriophage sp.]
MFIKVVNLLGSISSLSLRALAFLRTLSSAFYSIGDKVI